MQGRIPWRLVLEPHTSLQLNNNTFVTLFIKHCCEIKANWMHSDSVTIEIVTWPWMVYPICISTRLNVTKRQNSQRWFYVSNNNAIIWTSVFHIDSLTVCSQVKDMCIQFSVLFKHTCCQ